MGRAYTDWKGNNHSTQAAVWKYLSSSRTLLIWYQSKWKHEINNLRINIEPKTSPRICRYFFAWKWLEEISPFTWRLLLFFLLGHQKVFDIPYPLLLTAKSQCHQLRCRSLNDPPLSTNSVYRHLRVMISLNTFITGIITQKSFWNTT